MNKLDTRTKILLGLCALLTVLLAAVAIVLIFKGRGGIKANAQLTNQSNTISEQQSEIEEYKSKLDSAESENSSLKEENEKIKKQMESLSKKKKNKFKRDGSLGEKVCYLTFDDGPSGNTPDILKTLSDYNAKATFFVIGTSKTEYMKNITDEGHSIGLHSATHQYSQIYTSADAYFADLESISNIVESKTGVKSRLIRFPGGSSNSISVNYKKGIMTELTKAVEERGYRYFDWNVSSGDAAGSNMPVDFIVNNITNGARDKNSICVLMHDSDAKQTTAEALPTVIENLSDMGFRFEKLTEESFGYHHGVNN